MKNNTWKRIAAGALALTLVSGNVPVQPIADAITSWTAITASADTTVGTWTSGGCTLTLFDTGTLTVSKSDGGDGVMANINDPFTREWKNELGNITNIVVEEGVTRISKYAFYKCPNLTSVTLPEGLETIGYSAFYKCTKLTNVTLPEGLTTIGDYAFGLCESFTSVTIPSTVTSIGSDAFLKCTSVSDVYCYPNAAGLTWGNSSNDFMGGKETKCHVESSQLEAYQSKFGNSVNVTFVGDLILAPTVYTKDSEGIADGIILKPGESIDTAGTTQELEFDSNTTVDHFGDGSQVGVIDSGVVWGGVTSFKLNEDGKFYCTNYDSNSLFVPGELKSFKVSYDSANDMWHIGQIGFSLIDSSDELNADLPEISSNDAKAWVREHIDEIKAVNPDYKDYYDFVFKYNGNYYSTYIKNEKFNINDFEGQWDSFLSIRQLSSVSYWKSQNQLVFLWRGPETSQTEEQNAPVSYMTWDDTEKKLVEQTGDNACMEYTEVTAETTAFEDGKWYVVNADTTISNRITVTGTAHLILADGKTLTASAGIEVSAGNTLNIYAQSEGDTAGILLANANDDFNAGIGGSENIDSGTVTVNGGNINVNGGDYAAGIGGGNFGAGGTVTVNGGTVTANGGHEGAGIGTGNNYKSGGSGRDLSGGTVTINGGTVTATGGNYAAGIGGGDNSRGATVTINGGTVTATGKNHDGYITPGIGAGADINDNGSLTVADTHGVFGGESADPTDIQTDYASTRWMYMIVKEVPHSHDFSYIADGATITATCNGMGVGDCDITEGLTMTISASDATYDGSAHGATLSTGYNETAFPGTYTIEYYKGNDKLESAPINAGEYTAKVTVGEATAVVDYKINKADFSSDLNVTIGDWVAGTTAKTPSVDGNVSGGEVSYQYKAIDAEDSSYKSTPPTTAGAYTVKATVAETANYKAATATANFTVIAPNFTTPSYSWNKVDGKWNCTASRTCTNAASLSETETVTATSSVKTPAKCEENGTTTYTATFENKAFATQTKDVADIPATGHHYGLPKWIINKDFTEAQAVFGCKDCDEGQEIVDAELTSVTTEPTYTSAGKTVYTAYVVFNGKGYSYEKTVTIPKIGLTHVEAVEPTCTEAGNIEYWFDAANEKYFTDANGENEITQAKTVVKAKGHSYGAPEWTWADDNSATAKFTCSEGDDEQTVKATVTSKTTDPTYIAEGKTVYTATVTFGGKSYTDTKTVTTDKLTYTAPTVSFLRGDGAVKLEWNAVEGAEQYGIAGYIDGKWTLLDKTNDTSFILTPLTAGEEYRVAVVTKLNGKWFNDFSKSILVSPKAPEVHVYPQITSIDYNEQYHQFKLNWSAVPNAENYGVAVYLAGKWKILTQTIPAGTTSFTSPKLKAGQTYKMLVCAKVNGKWDLNAMTSRAFEVTVK